MLESAWIFVGRIAFVWTVIAVAGTVYFPPEDDRADGLVSNAGVVGFVLWGVWTFGALNVEVLSSGVTVRYSHPELALLGVTMAVIPGYIALTGPVELINRARQPSADQV